MKTFIILLLTIGSASFSFGSLSSKINSNKRSQVEQSRTRFQLALADAELQALEGKINTAATTLVIVMNGLNKTNYRPKTKVVILKKIFALKASIEPSLNNKEKEELENAVFSFRRNHPELTQYLL